MASENDVWWSPIFQRINSYRKAMEMPLSKEDDKFVEEVRIALAGASKDAPTESNERGGKQSAIGYRFDLIDGPALAAMAAVLHQGAIKYGENNWRLIDVGDHLNHLLMHTFAYLAGDTQDDHLSHILCRATFAQAVALQGGPLDALPVQK